MLDKRKINSERKQEEYKQAGAIPAAVKVAAPATPCVNANVQPPVITAPATTNITNAATKAAFTCLAIYTPHF